MQPAISTSSSSPAERSLLISVMIPSRTRTSARRSPVSSMTVPRREACCVVASFLYSARAKKFEEHRHPSSDTVGDLIKNC